MSRACPPGASCPPRWRWAAGCRRFILRSAVPSSAYLDGAEIWRRLRSVPIEPYTPYTITDMQALFDRVRADREQDFPLWTRNSSRGFARLPSRFSTAPARRSAPSISRRTPRAPPATRCREKFLPELRRIAQRISQAPRRSKARPFVASAQLVTGHRKILKFRFAFRTAVRISNKSRGH